MKLLITSSRMPYALDAVRKLGERGHEVHACDSYKAAPGSHSKYLAGHFTTASATDDPGQFVSDVEEYAGEHGIELIVPMFEEIFYMAAQHERLSKVTKLYAPPFRTLAQVHDKGTFQELCDKLGIRTPQTAVAHDQDELKAAIEKFPQFFGRAAFSRGGVGLMTNTGPLAGALKPEDVHPTEANPWLVQEFVDGPMHCTYSCIHGGEVATHMSYRAPRQWEHSTGIQFESIDASDTLPTVEKLAADLNWDGQMSLDFVDAEQGLMMIECNPRPTDGLLLMSAEELERGLLAPTIETLQVEPGRMEELDFAVLGQIFQQPLKDAPNSIHDLAAVKGTDTGWHDVIPQLYSFLAFAHHERMSLEERKGLFEAMSDGITWDGQAIPGLPADDAAYLAKLTGD
jgi:predicted ATP-grasp superfamily ATP-dependent carboligase